MHGNRDGILNLDEGGLLDKRMCGTMYLYSKQQQKITIKTVSLKPTVNKYGNKYRIRQNTT